MPSFTTIFEDTSPMILYSGVGWNAGHSSGDPSAEKYTESSFTVTQTMGSSMSFAFYGSSVAIYGAKRWNHGAYSATIDDGSPIQFNGKATPDLFNQVLFSSDFDLGQHNLTVFNDNTTFFDVDYIMVKSNIGVDDEDIIVNTYQNTHPAFTYTPASSWTTPSNVGMFVGGSGHATTQPGSKVEFSFQGKLRLCDLLYEMFMVVFVLGDAIAIYGPVGPNSTSGYFVQIDNGTSSLFSANKEFYHPQQLLFFAANIGAGQHSLVIQLASSPHSGEFAIDFATVYTSPSLGGAYLSAGSPTLSNGRKYCYAHSFCSFCRQLTPVVIAGLALSTTIAVLTSLFSIFVVRHYRRTINSYKPQTQDTRSQAVRSTESMRTVRPFPKTTFPHHDEQRFGSFDTALSSERFPDRMPSFTTIFEDTSPMILYSEGWRAGHSSDDSSAERYTESSFTVTQATGSSISFVFYGSSVAVYGAKRGNHGAYSATIDDGSPIQFDGKATPDLFNQVMFSSDFDLGQHNLTVFNDDTTFFDVDYIMIKSNIGVDDEDIIVNTYQNTHPAFTYTPASSWNTPSNVGTFVGGSGHATTQPGSKVEFSFQMFMAVFVLGDAIAIYGPVGPNSTSGYFVQIDNGTSSLFSANKQFYHPQQLLFFEANIGAGQHSLVIQLASSPHSGEFAIDFATVYTSPSLGGAYLSAGSPTLSSGGIQTSNTGHTVVSCPANSRQLTPGVIAGLALSTTIAVLTSLFSIFVVWHYRRTINSYKPQPQDIQSQDIQPQYIQPQPQDIRSQAVRRTGSMWTARPFPKTTFPHHDEQRFGSFDTASVGSTLQSPVTGSSTQQRRVSISSVITQPPQYQ
ncbi:hypothetical protein CVT25_015876 [Psilocybe cyanescens]|uniref:Transmembrane protein n=1 Tax=Psilocybe cyanescens TaxID=93625 RepID=A0A409XII0_PSICY|nr:hypothetical protein CVT25_015876 [Psilocybe cyanescens]